MSSKSPSVSSASPPRPIKKENSEEEIKEFAETAMNELLGWYGYERLELRRWAAATRARDASPDSRASPVRKDKDECAWCNNRITMEGALQQSGASFCSELCFSQSRRATFKRAKTCDWCRHVRHTVAYVDFQDGATQLQFCSDKCLNQYKMHIFCRETQAHLDLNPHLVSAASASSLITPDLWLKNCKSRSVSPNSERSTSPYAENLAKTAVSSEKDAIPAKTQSRNSPMPIITIAPTSKLLKQKPPSEERVVIQKSPENKKELRTAKFNLRKRRASKCSATVTSQSLSKQSNNSTVPKAQDLRTCSPPSTFDGSSPSASSTIGNSTLHSPTQPINPNPVPNFNAPAFPNQLFGMPPPIYLENNQQSHTNDARFAKNMFPHPSFMPRPGMQFLHERPRIPPPIHLPQMGIGQPPPVTILVPYPVIIPLPLPIPIPLPMSAFLQAHSLHKSFKPTCPKFSPEADTDGPLDFTINSDKKKEKNMSHNTKDIPKGNNDTSSIINKRLEEPAQEKTDDNSADTSNLEQTLPKFKITRLGSKMAKIVQKTREPSESTRPLRKRRRLVEVLSEDDGPIIPKTRKIVEV